MSLLRRSSSYSIDSSFPLFPLETKLQFLRTKRTKGCYSEDFFASFYINANLLERNKSLTFGKSFFQFFFYEKRRLTFEFSIIVKQLAVSHKKAMTISSIHRERYRYLCNESKNGSCFVAFVLLFIIVFCKFTTNNIVFLPW